MPLSRKIALLAAAAVCACSNPQAVELVGDGPQQAGARGGLMHGVLMLADADGLVIRNGGTAPVYIFAADRAIVPLINWTVCTDPVGCRSVPAGATSRFASTTVAGWGTSQEVSVFWWRLVPAQGGGFRADSIRVATVRR